MVHPGNPRSCGGSVLVFGFESAVSLLAYFWSMLRMRTVFNVLAMSKRIQEE